MSAVKDMFTNLDFVIELIDEVEEEYSEKFINEHGISIEDVCMRYLHKDNNALFHLHQNAYECKLYDFNESFELARLFNEALDAVTSIIEEFSTTFEENYFDLCKLIHERTESK